MFQNRSLEAQAASQGEYYYYFPRIIGALSQSEYYFPRVLRGPSNADYYFCRVTSGPSHAECEDAHSSPPENQVRIDIHYWVHVANDLKDGPRQGILIAESKELW